MAQKYVATIAIIVSLVLAYGLIEGSITGNIVAEKEEQLVIHFPIIQDIPNAKESTILFDLSFPKSSFKVGNKSADVLMFLNSQTIPNLQIGYLPKEKKFFAGLPQMKSGEIELLDGQSHKLIYQFHKGNKIQALYLDGVLLAQGEYSGKLHEDLVTGFAIYRQPTYVESDIPIKVSYS